MPLLQSVNMRRTGLAVPSFPAPFDPLTLSPTAWHKADAITGKSDGNSISQWNDSSGNARHLLQATGGAQPLYKTAIQNGLPVVRCDGSNDFLKALFTFNSPLTKFVVAKFRTSSNGIISSGISQGDGSTYWLLQRNSSTNVRALGPVDLSITTTPEAWHNYGLTTVALSHAFRIDGGTAQTSATNSTTHMGGLYLGTEDSESIFGAVDIAEVLCFSSVLGTTDRQNVEAYLRAKWGTP